MRIIERNVLAIIMAVVFALPASLASAQDAWVERVRFASGSSGSTINETIRGYEMVEYVLGVSAGQRMKIDLSTSNASNYFNVTAPGASAAMFVGSTSGNSFEAVIPSSGDYRILVYLMRNAARRNETASYTIGFHVGGSSAIAPAPDYADGLTGGPDFWEVWRVPAGDTLNVRSRASTAGSIIGRVSNGAKLRNLGCRMNGNTRWCNIQEPDGSMTGWVAGRYLRETSAPAAPAPDYADGLDGGPDFWRVWRVPAGDTLNVRSRATASSAVIGQVGNDARLRNLGCRMNGSTRWCRVQRPDGGMTGWVAGRYLRE